MIEYIDGGPFEHPLRDDAKYHLMLTIGPRGEAELHAAKDTGSGWYEYGPTDQLMPATEQLARDLSESGDHVVLSYAWSDPGLIPRGLRRFRRVK